MAPRLGPSAFFGFFSRKWHFFWAARNATKNGTGLGEAQHPFCNPENYHEKSENFSKKSRKLAKNGVTDQPYESYV
jgi:hypothetical protein